jgi:hypothetical protein
MLSMAVLESLTIRVEKLTELIKKKNAIFWDVMTCGSPPKYQFLQESYVTFQKMVFCS